MNTEIRLLSVSDRTTKTKGRIVTATVELLTDDADQFKAMVGDRYGTAWVKIDDDETTSE